MGPMKTGSVRHLIPRSRDLGEGMTEYRDDLVR
jgi:hypothetical protein